MLDELNNQSPYVIIGADENNSDTEISNELKKSIKIDLTALLMKYDKVEPLANVISEVRRYLQVD